MKNFDLPKENQGLEPAKFNRDMIDALIKRRSSKILDINPDFGPDDDEFAKILEIALRVPDHGKIAPWRFINLVRGNRLILGEKMADIYKSKYKMDDNHYNQEKSRFLRGNRVLIMISSPDINHPKVPVWEQELSAGAVGFSMVQTFYAFGYDAAWLSEWPMFDDDIKTLLELKPTERIFGFLYIGKANKNPIERERPILSKILSNWGDN